MSQFIEIITKPVTAIESKFGKSWKKILICLGIIVGILLVSDLISSMYATLLQSKAMSWTGKMDFNVLKDFNYFKHIFTFLLRQIIFFGSIFAGIFIYCYITKKEFKLVDVLTLIVVAYTANYLLQAALNIIFMFGFMDVKFLNALNTALHAVAQYYSLALILFGIQKLYGFEFNNKGTINLVIMLAVIYVIYYVLCLVI